MAYQSLYRRYRPRRFDEVRAQEHVVRALRNAVREGRVAHAYLFSGPRGTGKTSTARILAKVLNCARPVDGEPDGTCESCLAVEAGTSFDIHELDAASNNKVEDIRDLVAKAALGTPGRSKVYILDEVHMLSPAASNALLKTLEEPPSHVTFVLATTDPQKVLPTIRSRTQHFEFHLLPADELAAYVRQVIDDAGLDVGPEGIEAVLRLGGGSARDTLSALDQVAAAGGVVESTEAVDELLDALCERDPGRALVAVAATVGEGRDPRVLGEALLDRLRDAFLATMKADLSHLSDTTRARVEEQAGRLGAPASTRALEALGEALVEMRQAPDPRIPLEVALVRLTRPDADPSVAALLERVDRLERSLANPAPPGFSAPEVTRSAVPGAKNPKEAPKEAPVGATKPAPSAARSSAAQPSGSREASRPEASDAPAPTRDELTLAWGDVILGQLPQRARVRFQAGRFVDVDGATAVFALPNEPHRSRCEELRGDVEAALAAHFGRPVHLRLVVDGDAPRASTAPSGLAAPTPPPPEDEEAVDLSELVEAPPDNRSGVDRLTEAFPGAKLVEGE